MKNIKNNIPNINGDNKKISSIENKKSKKNKYKNAKEDKDKLSNNIKNEWTNIEKLKTIKIGKVNKVKKTIKTPKGPFPKKIKEKKGPAIPVYIVPTTPSALTGNEIVNKSKNIKKIKNVKPKKPRKIRKKMSTKVKKWIFSVLAIFIVIASISGGTTAYVIYRKMYIKEWFDYRNIIINDFSKATQEVGELAYIPVKNNSRKFFFLDSFAVRFVDQNDVNNMYDDDKENGAYPYYNGNITIKAKVAKDYQVYIMAENLYGEWISNIVTFHIIEKNSVS